MGGREGKRPKTLFFLGKRHDNMILKVHIVLSRNLLSLRRLLEMREPLACRSVF